MTQRTQKRLWEWGGLVVLIGGAIWLTVMQQRTRTLAQGLASLEWSLQNQAQQVERRLLGIEGKVLLMVEKEQEAQQLRRGMSEKLDNLLRNWEELRRKSPGKKCPPYVPRNRTPRSGKEGETS